MGPGGHTWKRCAWEVPADCPSSLGPWACIPPPPTPQPPPVGSLSLDGLWVGQGVTHAGWEVLFRLYFCMTPWNRPMGAEAAGFSGGALDLEGAGQE